jgi:phosphoribosyl-AMP cyclohydrolase
MPYTALFNRWVERLRREEPRCAAILCHGSYARNEAAAHSDLDLDLLIDGEPEVGYLSAFEELENGRLLHATISVQSLDEWLEQFDEPGESEEWAFFLTARQIALLLWATPTARKRLEGRLDMDFACSPQLQDLIESAAKVRNAMDQQDELGVRLGAQDMALRCPALLEPLNPPVLVGTRRAALQAALDFSVAPAGYRKDMLLCLGMSGQTNTIDDIHAAALRLATGIVELLRRHPETIADRLEPELPKALADGRVLRLLTQPG